MPARATPAPLSLRCYEIGARTVQVQGQVDGKPCSPTVDTGAESTVVREGATAARNPPVAAQQLCGITGHCAQLRGPVHARIRVGQTEEEMPVYVANVDENLLGVDFLQRSKAVLDFGAMAMTSRGSEVPLLEGDGDLSCASLCCRRNTRRVDEPTHPKAPRVLPVSTEEDRAADVAMGDCQDVSTRIVSGATTAKGHIPGVSWRSRRILSPERTTTSGNRQRTPPTGWPHLDAAQRPCAGWQTRDRLYPSRRMMCHNRSWRSRLFPGEAPGPSDSGGHQDGWWIL